MVRPVIFGIGKLGRRLTLAFLGVALVAVIVMFVLLEFGTRSDVSALVARQEDALADSVAVTSAALHDNGGWQRVDLRPVLDLVAREGAAAEVRDASGRLVQATPGFAKVQASHVYVTPIYEHHKRVGHITLKFSRQDGLGSAVSQFDSQRLRAGLGALGIVALIALVVSLLMSRQITLPLERVLATLRARGAGDRSVRIGDAGGTGVIHELSVALNESSDAIDKRDRLQRNLVANIAHELRTPVAILQASHEAMIDGVSAPTPENLWSLRDEVLRLARMIEDLQRLAAAEAAALQLQLVPRNLAEIADDAAARLSDSFGAASVDLNRRLKSAWILCDADRMREVIVNLLTNALKFTPAGGQVTLRTGLAGRGLARLTVIDTGIGIPSDELPRVTERFFRGQRSSEMATGSGIGLTIVAELVHAQHGDLEISSEPDRGTQATVTIPSTRPQGSWPWGPRHRSGSEDREDQAEAPESSDLEDRFADVPRQPRGLLCFIALAMGHDHRAEQPRSCSDGS